MTLLRVGKHLINLDYLIRAEEDGAGPGKDRLRLEEGEVLDLEVDETKEWRASLVEHVPRKQPIARQARPV